MFARRIMVWCLSSSMRTDLVLDLPLFSRGGQEAGSQVIGVSAAERA